MALVVPTQEEAILSRRTGSGFQQIIVVREVLKYLIRMS